MTLWRCRLPMKALSRTGNCVRMLLPPLVLLVLLPCGAYADLLTGGRTIATVRKGECLSAIGSRYGVDWRLIAEENDFDPKRMCRQDQQFSVSNLRVVPKVVDEGIIVNVPDRMLYFFRNSQLVMAFPVGLGLPQKEWQTPLGPFSITHKETNPTWHVPRSIQREMKRKGQKVRKVVPPGKDDPLGRYALHTTITNVLIHETIWPTTVYQWRSHGCIRVGPDVMKEFFEQAEKGTTGKSSISW